jgi:hypothetical protein
MPLDMDSAILLHRPFLFLRDPGCAARRSFFGIEKGRTDFRHILVRFCCRHAHAHPLSVTSSFAFLQLPVKLSVTERDGRSPLGDRDHEQILEEFAGGERIWRILMMEECRLGLVANPQSERRGGSRSRGGGVNVPMASRGSIVAILSDYPTAAYEVIVLGNLNVSNLRMISAGMPVEIRVCLYPRRRCERPAKKNSENQSQS